MSATNLSIPHPIKRISITVSGRVQGTFFRSSAKKLADRLGIVGYAKNLPDGRVQIVGEGEEATLRKFLDWCYRGSVLAKVSGLSFLWEDKDAKGAYRNFHVDLGGRSYLEDKVAALVNLSKKVFAPPPTHVPSHVAIIPDGNRRWAEDRNLPAWRGHERGFRQTIALAKEVRRLGIRYLTLWGFSTENWSRSKSEIQKLMRIFQEMARVLRKEAFKHQVAIHHFGRKDRLPGELVTALRELERDTERFSKYHLGLALDYGGRDEILRAIGKLTAQKQQLSETTVSQALDTNGFPDPSLIIRTGGEQRLSGMMPWQSAYAELYFSPLYFPDFGPPELRYAIADFSLRQRRFGR